METRMRFFAVVLLIAAGCGKKHDYSGWKKYAPAESAFEVYFPADFAVKPPSKETGDLHIASIRQPDADKLGFNCQWKDMGQPAPSKDVEVKFLGDVQKGSLVGSKGKLLEEKEISLGSYVGREFIMDAAEPKAVAHYRMYVAGKRFVMLQVWGKDKNAVSSAEAMKFLDSLTFK
jgi:hypothetical protein